MTAELLRTAAELAIDWLDELPSRPVHASKPVLPASMAELPEGPLEPGSVIAELAEAVEPALVASAGPRYFGFVTGGSLPGALAADWLVSAWDQNVAYSVMSPAAAGVEAIVIEWLTELLRLPPGVSGALVTGGQMANTTCLAAARNHVLARRGWDVEQRGLAGAPPTRVIVGDERHVTIDASLRLLGFGTDAAVRVPVDGQGRMQPDAVAAELDDDPTIVCVQAGNVNTGAFDPFEPICASAERVGAWVHVDGAFGLWAAASPTTSHLMTGADRADSWATDGHKWLNVPYDCGVALTAHPDAHRKAMSISASYLAAAADARDGTDWSPEASRRARAFVVWTALRTLGRQGVADLVERCCALAGRFAAQLQGTDGVEVLNDVVLNQVLVRFGASDNETDAVIGRVQAGGECWMGGTTWQGRRAMRISVSNWSTTESDVDRSVAAIRGALQA